MFFIETRLSSHINYQLIGCCSEISGSHDCFLGCCSIIVLMMEAVSTSETLVSFYDSTRRKMREDSYLQVPQ
jgi:hypothetical protein